nr:hypothetical protein CFP56_41249 [Quercus suber]
MVFVMTRGGIKTAKELAMAAKMMTAVVLVDAVHEDEREAERATDDRKNADGTIRRTGFNQANRKRPAMVQSCDDGDGLLERPSKLQDIEAQAILLSLNDPLCRRYFC